LKRLSEKIFQSFLMKNLVSKNPNVQQGISNADVETQHLASYGTEYRFKLTFPNRVLERVKLYRISVGLAVLNSAVVNSREVKYRYSKLLLKSQIVNLKS